MRVLLLANSESVHVIRLARGLSDRGMDVHLASLSRLPPELKDCVTFHPAPFRGKAGYFLNALWLRRTIHALRPDIVNAHYLSGYGTLAMLSGVSRLIQTGWGSDVYFFPNKSPVHRWLIRRNLRAGQKVVVATKSMQAVQKNIADMDSNIIPFGVDTARFYMSDTDPAICTPFSRGDFIFGMCKSLAPVYGHASVIRALARAKTRTTMRLRLVIVGDGPERDSLKALCRSLNMQDDVFFAGAVTHDVIPVYQNIFSAYVVASDNESLCVAALEAGACGKPVISVDVGAMREILADGACGMLVPWNDEAALAGAMVQLAEDGDLARQLGQHLRERVAGHYSWDMTLDKTINLYGQVAS